MIRHKASNLNTIKLLSLSEEKEREMWRLYRYYLREAERCEKSDSYLAGCIMLGSALEALLMIMTYTYPEDAISTGLLPQKNGKVKPLSDWNLSELLKVAKKTNWLPAALRLSDDWSSQKALVGDYAEVIRLIRNLAHPGNYLKNHLRNRVTKKYLMRQFEILDYCRDSLIEYNNKSLLKSIK